MSALIPVLALAFALSVAAASAHGDRHGRFRHEGFRDNRAVVTGTITSVGSGSFGASAYVVTPGAGNAGATPAATAATITVGSGTRVVTAGQSALTVGDTFYAVYRGVSDSTPLSTLAGDTPSAIYAFVAPTPPVEVKGVVTAAPASGSDSFSATTFVVAPRHRFPKGQGYSYGRHVGGSYGYKGSADHGHGDHHHHGCSADCEPGSADASVVGTANTTITTDANTKVTLNGRTTSVSNLVVGEQFVAIYNGTPSESLSTITATPAISVRAWAAPTGDSLYGFVGTVTSTGAGTITVNVTGSIPKGMFSGADTFTVDSQTKVLGNTNLAPGNIVAGGLIAQSGENASTVGSTPLQLLVDYAPVSSSSSTAQTAEQTRRVEHRALGMLLREKERLGRHHDKYLIVRK